MSNFINYVMIKFYLHKILINSKEFGALPTSTSLNKSQPHLNVTLPQLTV